MTLTDKHTLHKHYIQAHADVKVLSIAYVKGRRNKLRIKSTAY